MIPNGTAYENFPSFANSGTRSAPDEAKYAQGMVPADTFPAEWANYFFHGATAGITRLNADTGSIKKEINNVLDNFNITPDGSLTNQLMSALDKLKQQAALAAHPVGSLYWTSSSENPAVTFGGGTWVQIKDKFILAAGDTYANGATGGAATVTLSILEMPSHYHEGITDVENTRHTHTGTTGTESRSHSHDSELNLYITTVNQGDLSARLTFYNDQGTGWLSNTLYTLSNTTSGESQTHTHDITTGTESASHRHNFTTGNNGGSQPHNNMPPYIVKYCWQRTA